MCKTRKHLTLDQRYAISALKANNKSINFIAKELNISKGTVSKELKRNSNNGVYNPSQAQNFAEDRRTKASQIVHVMTEQMQKLVITLLKEYLSPEQISGKLKKDGILISHESIYKMIWKDKRNGGTLYKYLRHGGKKYNKRKGKTAGRGLIPNRVDIKERDAIVEEKSRIGDLEADLVIGKNHQGAIVTLVDRYSKIAFFMLVPNKTKEVVTQAIICMLIGIKDHIHTITFDNGKEFAGHEDIAKALNVKCYFATPYHSWERGLNEHTNGHLRQFVPKKTDFRKLTHEDIEKYENLINNRPRKILKYKTPSEVFQKALGVSFQG